MINIRFLVIILFGIILGFASCRKDSDVVIETPILMENEVLGSITGQVVDESNEPVENATVILNDDLQTTDENGFFLFKEQTLNGAGTVVKVQSAQHFEVSKIVNPKPKANTIVYIKLLDKKLVGTINAAVGGTIQVSGTSLEGEVDFPENAFVLKGSDTPYAGDVQVFGRLINPANNDDVLAIPGDLRAVNASNELVQLASYSMMSISLETSDGQQLDLANNKEATLSFPIDPTLQTNAPSTIPLWHYNIETGHWEEEGSAELVNNQYQGKVSHFSFWNCDVPFPLVQISGRVIDEIGNPLAGITVSIKLANSALVGYDYTNNAGEFSGGIPKDEELEITFSKNYDCIDFSISQNLGAFSNDITLGDIKIDLSDFYFISGRLLSCEGEVIPNGQVIISADEGNTLTYANSDGFFIVPACYTNFSLTAVDYVNDIRNEPVKFESSINENTNVGDVLLCSKLDTYITLNYNGSTFRMEDATTYRDTSSFTIYAETAGLDSLDYKSMRLLVNSDLGGDIAGVYENGAFAYFSGEDDIEIVCWKGDISCDIAVEIISSDQEDIYIIGTYEGMVKDNNMDDELIPISGSFKALRTF